MKAFFRRMVSYWFAAVLIVAGAIGPRIFERISDALIDEGASWAWHTWQLPAILANLWIAMEANPLTAAAGASLAWLVGAATFAAISLRAERPNRAFWQELELAFANIATEVQGNSVIREINGAVEWFVYPADKGDVRDRDRFRVTARRAGAAVKRLSNVPLRYPSADSTDVEDHWLNAVTALVYFSNNVHGNGTDEKGRYTSEHFDQLVRSSRDACHRLANFDVEPAVAGPQKPRRRR